MKDYEYLLNYEDLLNLMIKTESNILIIGPAGSGKSRLIKQLLETRNDIIVVAPSGIAADNIGGSTIQSYFSITPSTYTIYESKLPSWEKQTAIRKAHILLIDEISMLRCEVLDIVDQKLRKIRESLEPFGGMKLLLLGDPCQMEPVTPDYEKPRLETVYPDGTPYSFYNTHVMQHDNYFNSTFAIYQLMHDFRHQDDIEFRDMLSDIRIGKLATKALNTLNKQYRHSNNMILNWNSQYLTVTKSRAAQYNKAFIDKLPGKPFIVEAVITGNRGSNREDLKRILGQFHQTLTLKEGMKIMFIINGKMGQPWVNGTMGIIKRIIASGQTVTSVAVDIKGTTIELSPTEHRINTKGNETIEISDEDEDWSCYNVPTIKQFPFIPAYAITIDKSQGLTLDHISIVMEKRNRPNQLYVALSRTRSIQNVTILGRKIRGSDVHVSKTAKRFLDEIGNSVIKVY